MKLPIVWRKTMDEAVRQKDAEMAALRKRASEERERLRREIDEIILPLAKDISKIDVRHHPADREYALHIRIDERMLEMFRYSPESALESVGREIAMQIMFKIRKKADEPHRA